MHDQAEEGVTGSLRTRYGLQIMRGYGGGKRIGSVIALLVGAAFVGAGRSMEAQAPHVSLVAPSLPAASKASPLDSGKKSSSEFTPVDNGGVARVVASHKGDVVLVNFWATWCSPCREELPHLLKLEKELGAQGFKLVVISADDPEQELEARVFLDSIGAKQPRYIKRTRDTDAFINAVDSAWSGALPAVFLYDRAGKRVKSFIGESDIELLAKTVRALVKETGAEGKPSK